MTDPDLLREAVRLIEEHGGIKPAARASGISYSTLHGRLQAAAANGITLPFGEAVAGFNVTHVSQHFDKEGNPAGGWIKSRLDRDHDMVLAAIEDALSNYKGLAELPEKPTFAATDLLTVYTLADAHLALYAWKAETGADYDLIIGERVLRESVTSLVAQAPASDIAILLNLGDFFHSDNNENRTRRSGNALDVDTRFAKVLTVGVNLLIGMVQMMLAKHKTVIIRNIAGNHDPYGALMLSVALAAFFSNEPRVVVDTSPDPFWFYRFGRVLLGATHGDMVKPEQMPQVMAARVPRDWGESDYRYVYLGHFHHKSKGGGEYGGAIWEIFQSPAAKDAWHHASGYVSGRSIVAITHHKDRGEVYRHTVSIAPQ